jgi:hypothetical protein
LRWLAPAVVAAALVVVPAVASAQTAPEVADGGAVNNFPDGITFSVSATSDSPIVELRLRYTVLPDGTDASGRPEFEEAESVEAEFELAGNRPPEIYLPPGTMIEYHWEATDADGDVGQSEEANVFYTDVRFEWQATRGEGVTVYYYSGSVDDAHEMLAAALETIATMSRLLGTEIPFGVQVWIYESPEDMRPALQRRSETYESQVITAGVRVASDTVLVLGADSISTLKHELTHVVTAQAGESALGSLPAWLDEGTAVYGQDDPEGFGAAVEQAIDRGSVLSVREISAYPGDPNKVNLFYGQAWSLVSFLIDEYGEEQFAQLYAEIKAGKRIESALEAVYGFGQDGLENEWRDAHGLPPRETEAADEPDDVAPSESEEDGGGSSLALVIGLAVAVVALAGGVAWLGIWAAKKG